MGGHSPVGNPSIDCVPGNAEVPADLLYRRPSLDRGGAIRARSCGHNPLIVANSVRNCTFACRDCDRQGRSSPRGAACRGAELGLGEEKLPRFDMLQEPRTGTKPGDLLFALLYARLVPKRSSSSPFALPESSTTGLRSGSFLGMRLPNAFASARTRFQLNWRSSWRMSRSQAETLMIGTWRFHICSS